MSGVVPHSRLEADVLIREMVPSDAQQAAELSGELGYPASANEIRQRLRELQEASHAVYAACLDGVVVGWIEIGIAHHLQSEHLRGNRRSDRLGNLSRPRNRPPACGNGRAMGSESRNTHAGSALTDYASSRSRFLSRTQLRAAEDLRRVQEND